jgi:uncharacterized membrane protein YhaH (DUF805 family)
LPLLRATLACNAGVAGMYETYPKFSLGFVAVLLIAALVLPAVMVFPSVGQTAAGVQIALMLLVLWAIRLVLVPDQQTWLDGVRFALVMLAALAALSFSPQDEAVDVLTRTGFLALLVVPAIGLALLSRRPKTLGFSINRDFWIVLAAVALLVGMNHFYLLAKAQGAAMVADLVMIAALANLGTPRQAPSHGNFGRRALNALSFLCILVRSLG